MNDVENYSVAIIIGNFDDTIVGENRLKAKSMMPPDEHPIEEFFVHNEASIFSSLIPHEETQIGQRLCVFNYEFFQYKFHLEQFVHNFNSILQVSNMRGILNH